MTAPQVHVRFSVLVWRGCSQVCGISQGVGKAADACDPRAEQTDLADPAGTVMSDNRRIPDNELNAHFVTF